MKTGLFPLLLLLAITPMFDIRLHQANADAPLAFVSAFDAGDEGAIHAYRLDPETGELSLLHRMNDVEHPFFMALSPNQKFLYSIHAIAFGGDEHEQVAAYAIEERSGRLRLLNRQSTLGSASCYVEVDATGKTVLVANYSTGSLAALPVREDGSLDEATCFIQHAGSSVDPSRQKGPYAHSIIVSPENDHAYAADLGLDQILCYRLDAEAAKLTANQQPFVRTPPGAGPRHLTFHPNGKYLYAINELKNSITMFEYLSGSGILIERQTVPTLPEDFDGKSYCADLKITPDGRYLYGTNRGHDTITAYSIGDDGRLTRLEIQPSLGEGPQNLAIALEGRLLLCANMPGNNVAVFRIDPQNGNLKSVRAPISMPKPSCIRVLP